MRIPRAGRIILLAWSALSLASPAARASEKPRVENLTARKGANQVSVSFRLVGAFSDDMREEIRSGAPVSFLHHVQAIRERRWWWNHRVVATEITTTVLYDPLTHQYTLRREVDGKKTDERSTDREEEAKAWMTEIRATLPLGADEGGAVTHARVRTEVRDRRLLFVVPWALKTPWENVTAEGP